MEAFQILSRGGARFDKNRFKADVELFTVSPKLGWGGRCLLIHLCRRALHPPHAVLNLSRVGTGSFRTPSISSNTHEAKSPSLHRHLPNRMPILCPLKLSLGIIRRIVKAQTKIPTIRPPAQIVNVNAPLRTKEPRVKPLHQLYASDKG